MKKFILSLFILAANTVVSQAPTAFSLSKEGLTDFIVTDVPDKSAADLYKRSIEWISAKYKDPSQASKEKVENSLIVFEGTAKPLISLNPVARVNHLSKFQVALSFKDGKYKFDVVSLEYFVPASTLDAGGWRKINISDMSEHYARTGELRSTYKYFTEIPEFFNKLNDELRQFALGESVAVKKSDW